MKCMEDSKENWQVLRSWEWNGLMQILESWKNQSEFQKSLENLFLKKDTNLLCVAVRGPTDKILHKVVKF